MLRHRCLQYFHLHDMAEHFETKPLLDPRRSLWLKSAALQGEYAGQLFDLG